MKLKHDGIWGWGSYGKVSYCVLGGMLKKKKNIGLKRSTLSGRHMTTGFDLFELPIRGLLQKGWEHSPPKFCFEEPSFLVGTAIAMGIHSAVNI